MHRSRHPPPSTEPSPDRTVGAVLSVVLAALAANDHPEPGHGVAVAYGFASDRMRAALGDLRAFERALHNTLNAPLVDHSAATVRSIDERGNAARADIDVTAPDGVTARFTVALVRPSHGARRGCWLLGGIAREGIDL